MTRFRWLGERADQSPPEHLAHPAGPRGVHRRRSLGRLLLERPGPDRAPERDLLDPRLPFPPGRGSAANRPRGGRLAAELRPRVTFSGGLSPQLDASGHPVPGPEGLPPGRPLTSAERYQRTVALGALGLPPAASAPRRRREPTPDLRRGPLRDGTPVGPRRLPAGRLEGRADLAVGLGLRDEVRRRPLGPTSRRASRPSWSPGFRAVDTQDGPAWRPRASSTIASTSSLVLEVLRFGGGPSAERSS